jgi:hypothetical protein
MKLYTDLNAKSTDFLWGEPNLYRTCFSCLNDSNNFLFRGADIC